MSIDSKQLSIVIQGPLFEGGQCVARKAVESARAAYPNAQIILSTSEAVDFSVEGLEIVEHASPLPFEDVNGQANNVNKLLASVNAGLARATREFCLKLRTDHVVCNDAIIGILQALESRLSSTSYFKRPVGVSNLFLRNPCKVPYLFHLTDTVQFGRTEDLRLFWRGDELSADFVFLERGPRLNPIGTFQGYTAFRLLPEQSLMLRFLAARGVSIDLKHISHSPYRLFRLWERVLVENFKVYNWSDLGVLPPARFFTAPYSPRSILTAKDYSRLERRRAGVYSVVRYTRLLSNKYVVCWLRRRWIVSTASLLVFSFLPRYAHRLRDMYRKVTGARRH